MKERRGWGGVSNGDVPNAQQQFLRKLWHSVCVDFSSSCDPLCHFSQAKLFLEERLDPKVGPPPGRSL